MIWIAWAPTPQSTGVTIKCPGVSYVFNFFLHFKASVTVSILSLDVFQSTESYLVGPTAFYRVFSRPYVVNINYLLRLQIVD